MWLVALHMSLEKIHDHYYAFILGDLRSISKIAIACLTAMHTKEKKTKGNKCVRTFMDIPRRKGKMQRSHMIFMEVPKLVFFLGRLAFFTPHLVTCKQKKTIFVVEKPTSKVHSEIKTKHC